MRKGWIMCKRVKGRKGKKKDDDWLEDMRPGKVDDFEWLEYISVSRSEEKLLSDILIPFGVTIGIRKHETTISKTK